MPFAPVNHTLLYYETYGAPKAGQLPIVLVHGSTQTGRSCWGEAAPLLARRYYVIVPDCRGHGQSQNLAPSYSFKELAADTAGLVKALGFERAHLVGHSNGGNVALVTLLEHPEALGACVLMAANAWVSPDLPAKEPAVFDPQRIAREDPAWMQEMITLHDTYQGSGYWRTLLGLTLAELISQPNYTAQDLAQVRAPVLAIQGANDRVNAPYRHAQFIAHAIPQAEAWLPEDTGHSVHEERLCEWVERVLDFLERRGDAPNEALQRLKQARWPDDRQSVFDVRWRAGRLQGRVLVEEQALAARQAVAQTAPQEPSQTLPQPPPQTALENAGLQVLLGPAAPWALLGRAVEDLRRLPALSSEMVSQVRMGEALRLLEECGDWAYVQVVHDGYLGWLHSRALALCSLEEVQSYQARCTEQVRAPAALAYPSSTSLEIAGRIPFGVRLAGGEVQNSRQAVQLPGGGAWWLALEDLARCPAPGGHPTPEQILRTLELARRFTGVPYLWGGRTPYGFDCSGLAGVFWAFLGVNLPRDADQQFDQLPPAPAGPLQPGDLLYFGEAQEIFPGQALRAISHVAISLGGDEFIHANVAQGGVGCNSFDEHSPAYRAWLKENYRGARRPSWN